MWQMQQKYTIITQLIDNLDSILIISSKANFVNRVAL